VKLRSSARILKAKAISSVRTSIGAFNSIHDDGRVTTVLLHLQHGFEMLLKAALNQSNITVFDKKTGRSVGFEAVIRQSQQIAAIKLTDEEAGTLRTVDAMRDDEQHWYNQVDEGLLYLHVRAAITLFDDLLQRVFSDRLADHLPLRVLPISIEPPQDFQILVDREYAKIAEMLQPGRRVGAEARARIRTLLAMEAHTEPETKVSDVDVTRVERGIRAGKAREQVFPRLSNVGAAVAGNGPEVQVRFVKKGGAPVTFIPSDAEVDAAAIRTVDLSKKFYIPANALAAKLGLSAPRALALRRHLGTDVDESMSHEFKFGRSKYVQYSDNAVVSMREAIAALDMAAIWSAHAPTRVGKPRSKCTEARCVTPATRMG